MNIYFDCEFTQLRQDTTLISIGLISSDNKSFYAEFTDYNKELANNIWLQKNVINRLLMKNRENEFVFKEDNYSSFKGDKKFIREKLLIWLLSFEEEIQMISDVCHYDFMLFIDLMSDSKIALDLPKFISPVCHDINQDIAHVLSIPDIRAFDVSRVDFIVERNLYPDINLGNTHNSLFDAECIKCIYEYIYLIR